MKIDRNYNKKYYNDFCCEVNDNINIINYKNNDNNNNNNYNNENEYYNDFSLNYIDDENRNIDNDYDVEFEKTRFFFYQYFIISIVVNEISKKFN